MKPKTREGDEKCNVRALQVLRDEGRIWLAGGLGGYGDSKVERVRIKGGDANVGARRGRGEVNQRKKNGQRYRRCEEPTR